MERPYINEYILTYFRHLFDLERLITEPKYENCDRQQGYLEGVNAVLTQLKFCNDSELLQKGE